MECYGGTGLGAVPDFSKGKTTKVSNGVSETRYKTFDVFGRLLTHEQRTMPEQLAGTEPAYTTAYAYNLSGALIEETYPSGRKVRNTLDRDGELALVQSRKNANYGFVNYASAFKYNSSGGVEKMRLGNGHWETAQYNNRLQVTQIGLGTTDADQNLLKLEYGYGDNTQNNGSLRSQKISFSGLSQAFEQTYTYDDLNRIQVAEEKVGGASNWKQTFQYDRFGNRRFDAANTTTLGSCPQAQCNPLINTSDNRFSGGQGYGYDQDGNVTQDATGQRFGYDAENHQKEFFAANNPSSTPDATYKYDGDGRRVKKISSLETTIFVYNAGGTLVAEYSSALSQTQQVSYLTTDHLGSPRVITNENGAVTTRQDFSAFGDETLTAQRTQGLGYKPDTIRQDYTGYQKDDESGGLEFAQARYYNTKHGRFTSIDPLTASATIKNPQTLNRYSYVLNSPYKFTDPLGLLSWSVSKPKDCTKGCAANGAWVNPGELIRDQVATNDARESHSGNADNTPATAVTGSEGEADAPAAEHAEAPPTISLPPFNELWKQHPGKNALPSKFTNQCAIKLSYALLAAGVDMSSFTGATETITVAGNAYKVAIRAYELWKWLSDRFGGASSNNAYYQQQSYKPQSGDINVADRFKGEQGIIILKDFWGDGQGHIDLWNGSDLGNGVVYGTNSYFDRSKEIILLDLNLMFINR